MARILVVDDEEGIRGFLKRGFEIDGYDVITAADGAEALEIVNETHGAFDLVVSDIRMPMMDGIAFALAAKRDFPDLLILLMTGYAEQRERCASLHSIIVDVMSKPFNLTEMREKVKVILAQSVKTSASPVISEVVSPFSPR
jgi:two-component system cell cycle response regulator CpdR